MFVWGGGFCCIFLRSLDHELNWEDLATATKKTRRIQLTPSPCCKAPAEQLNTVPCSLSDEDSGGDSGTAYMRLPGVKHAQVQVDGCKISCFKSSWLQCSILKTSDLRSAFSPSAHIILPTSNITPYFHAYSVFPVHILTGSGTGEYPNV